MKLYVLDDNGSVVFEFTDVNGAVSDLPEEISVRKSVSQEVSARLISLLKQALKFLQRKEK